MRDKNGKIDNRAQVIRSLDKLRLAHFLSLIVENPNEYPRGTVEWLEWLNADSRESIDKL